MKYDINQTGYEIVKNGHDVLRIKLQPDTYLLAARVADTHGEKTWDCNVFTHTQDGDTFCADNTPIFRSERKEDVVAWIVNNPNQIRFAVIRAKYRAKNNIK